MPPKKSPIWKYFQEDGEDPTTVVCKVPGCSKPKVSRGKASSGKSNLTNTSMLNHLKNNHSSVHVKFLKDKSAIESAEKKKIEEEKNNEEMESGSIPLFNLRTQGQRKEYLQHQQANLNSWVGVRSNSSQLQGKGTTYDIHDVRAKFERDGT